MNFLDHPYSDLAAGDWLRGNLHAHTTRSDGRRPPQAVIDDYANRGYDFLMLSDHDVWTSLDDLGGLESRGLVLLPGNEITAGGPHILHVNAGGLVPPHARRQETLNEIAADAGSFAVACHPNWLFACPGAAFSRVPMHPHTTFSQLSEWVGCAGLEIYNGATARLDGSPYATNVWDLLLATGRKVWGFANDDSHRAEGDIPLPGKVDHTPLMRSDMALGWNVVRAERSGPAIVDALCRGRFYASTGVEITAIRVEGMTVRIETRNAGRLIAFRETGRRFAQVEGSVLEIEVPDDARYVRFEAWGHGEQCAWTQPFFVEGNASSFPKINPMEGNVSSFPEIPRKRQPSLRDRLPQAERSVQSVSLQKSMTHPLAIIFDLDETLVETSGLWRRAESELLASLGHRWTAERAARYKGRNVADVAEFIHADVQAARLLEECQAFFREALFRSFARGPIEPMPGAVECVRRLGAVAPLAVASGSPLPLIELAMDGLGLRGQFACLVSSESVPRGKPHPDVFLAAAKALGVPPESCLVIEDSLAGLRAAKAAGMRFVVIPSLRSPEIVAEAGDCVFDTLDEVDPRSFAEL